MAITTQTVEIQRLLFDPENPRMAVDPQGDQQKIFRFLVDDIGVEDVLNSLAASGMIAGDPLIARPAESPGDFYIIEGNRRLAALKLLNGQKIGDGEPEPIVPQLAPEVAETLRRATIQLGWDQDKLDAYLGYKHVTSAREWAPEAKALFCRDAVVIFPMQHF